MFVNSESTSNYKHKNGLCLAQRRAGNETLVQWQNGDQRWYETNELQGKIILVDPENSRGAEDG
jgi:hypothetical protein